MHDAKTYNSKRDIPLTTETIRALMRQKFKKQEIILKGNTASKEYEDLVFFTQNNRPTHQILINQSIKVTIYRANAAGIELQRFTSHTFRHTFATRAIERGMNPKTLQKILGHSTLQMTMDLYCHVTDDTLFAEMEKFEKQCDYFQNGVKWCSKGSTQKRKGLKSL